METAKVTYIKRKKSLTKGYSGTFRVIDKNHWQYNKDILLGGNIPVIPEGTVLTLTYEWDKETKRGKITDYNIFLSDRNLKLLAENINGFDAELFMFMIEHHKQTGFDWLKLVEVIKNPYAVYPFAKADALFKKIGREKTDYIRMTAILNEITVRERKLRKDRLSVEEFYDFIEKIERKGAYKPLSMIEKTCLMEADTFCLGISGGEVYLFDTELKNASDYIKKDMEKRNLLNSRLLTDEQIGRYMPLDNLDDDQLASIKCLRTTKPAIVTGGAGRGKTTVIMSLIQCYTESYPDAAIGLFAPTGRASRRLSSVTGWDAYTIHRGIGKIPDSDYTTYNDYNKLPCDLIIVDESSMIDTLLMYDLLKAVRDDTKLIFVGDHRQLYPVGTGEPFFDFMQENLCEIYYLRFNHRQDDNDIEKNSDLAYDGKPFENGKGVTICDVSFSQIPGLLKKIEDAAVKEAQSTMVSPSAMQIISPFNKMNLYINHILQKKTKESTDPRRFAEGDKVIAVKNREDYCNGDIGYVTELRADGMYIQFEDGRRVFIENGLMDDIQLAYSVTVHKMQGSECKKVFLFLPKDEDEFITNRLLYTAVTRAKSRIIIYYYSENDLFKNMLRKRTAS